MTSDLAVSPLQDVRKGNAHGLTRSGHTHELTRVRPDKRSVRHDLVVLSDEKLDLGAHVRDRFTHHPEHHPGDVATCLFEARNLFVLDEIFREVRIDDRVDITILGHLAVDRLCECLDV